MPNKKGVYQIIFRGRHHYSIQYTEYLDRIFTTREEAEKYIKEYLDKNFTSSKNIKE